MKLRGQEVQPDATPDKKRAEQFQNRVKLLM